MCTSPTSQRRLPRAASVNISRALRLANAVSGTFHPRFLQGIWPLTVRRPPPRAESSMPVVDLRDVPGECLGQCPAQAVVQAIIFSNAPAFAWVDDPEQEIGLFEHQMLLIVIFVFELFVISSALLQLECLELCRVTNKTRGCPASAERQWPNCAC